MPESKIPTPETLRQLARMQIVSQAEANIKQKEKGSRDSFWADQFGQFYQQAFTKAAEAAGLTSTERWKMLKEQAQFLATLNEEQFKELMGGSQARKEESRETPQE